LFNSIEINSSFYKLPMPATFARWAASVPGDFRFTVKLWRDITHVKGLHFKEADLDRFIHAASHIGARKGCLLIQFPASLTADSQEGLQKLLHRIRQKDADPLWKLAVEFRHRSWNIPAVHDLLDHYQAGIVLHDIPVPGWQTFAGALSATGEPSQVGEPSLAGEAPGFYYLRFHGPQGDYKGSYPDAFLRDCAHRIRTWLSLGKEVYVYFNNTIGDAIPNLITLDQFVKQETNE
jgi:uncharacterized protein YecE (DUF72 family)